MVLYSLGDGSPTATQREVFHGSPVLGKAVLTGDEPPQATRAFREATSAGEPDSIPRCFEPHHAMRITYAGHRYDYLICYTCGGLLVYNDDKKIAAHGIDGSPAGLNTLLTQHHIAIAADATTDYIANAK